MTKTSSLVTFFFLLQVCQRLPHPRLRPDLDRRREGQALPPVRAPSAPRVRGQGPFFRVRQARSHAGAVAERPGQRQPSALPQARQPRLQPEPHAVLPSSAQHLRRSGEDPVYSPGDRGRAAAARELADASGDAAGVREGNCDEGPAN